MPTLIVFALVGFGAQLVDGALGMAYGVTSTSLLLAAGINPATAEEPVAGAGNRPRCGRHRAPDLRGLPSCALAELPARRRELLRALFFVAEPNYAEISREMGLPVGSIGPTRQRMLRTLRGGLERAGRDPRAVA